MPKNVPISDAVTNMGALTLLLNGLKAGNAELIKEGMFDKLHEPYRWKLIKCGLEVKNAGLIGANAIMNSPLSKEKLLELDIDIEGHTDNVVPSLLGGLCLTARSSSQRWRIIRCDWHDSIKAVVAIPAIRLSTSEARKVMPKNVPISDAVINMGALTLLLNGLKAGNAELIKEGMFDKLHEPYRWKLIKGGLEVKDAALNAGALGCAISGAGPSILALCKKENGKNVSQAMVKAWEKSGVASRAPFLNVQTTGSQFSTISGK